MQISTSVKALISRTERSNFPSPKKWMSRRVRCRPNECVDLEKDVDLGTDTDTDTDTSEETNVGVGGS